jgi:hypothetical protein
MKNSRLHAYQTLHRVARVREMRTSQALADASVEERLCRMRCEHITTVRDGLAGARRVTSSDPSRLDMGRYAMLSQMDAEFADQQYHASMKLVAAEKITQERAERSVAAKRYCEKIDERVTELVAVLDHKASSSALEDAIELWIEGKSR